MTENPRGQFLQKWIDENKHLLMGESLKDDFSFAGEPMIHSGLLILSIIDPEDGNREEIVAVSTPGMLFSQQIGVMQWMVQALSIVGEDDD